MSSSQAPSSPTITATEFGLETLAATREFGRRLAALLVAGDIVRLEGDLGAGKSELARSVIHALAGAEIEVPSPTFTLAQHYPLPGLPVMHADLYRIGSAEEIFELGIMEALDDGCLLVEWPENAEDLLPLTGLRIRLLHASGMSREARVEALDSGWVGRMKDLVAGD
ncbi:MAG: tRNA (adenosine(37)-N6)-threonylcarbamoyltransferase complex ATPase subunit type 1 TsaE [Geminicoccaceae bacterium]